MVKISDQIWHVRKFKLSNYRWKNAKSKRQLINGLLKFIGEAPRKSLLYIDCQDVNMTDFLFAQEIAQQITPLNRLAEVKKFFSERYVVLLNPNKDLQIIVGAVLRLHSRKKSKMKSQTAIWIAKGNPESKNIKFFMMGELHRVAIDTLELLKIHGPLTVKELAQLKNSPDEDVEVCQQRLRRLFEKGLLVRREAVEKQYGQYAYSLVFSDFTIIPALD